TVGEKTASADRIDGHSNGEVGMKTTFAAQGKPGWRSLLIVLAVSGAAVAGYPFAPWAAQHASARATDPSDHEGKRPEKVYTGRSFASQTRVVAHASASAT